MTRLPRSLEDLRGLRAARWLRESTTGQFDRYGPDAQREQQDRAIARHGLLDTGIGWQVAHSGRTIATTSQWAAMVAAAGGQYDVLVVGYVSRFARDARTALNARHDLHAAGAAILFVDEGILTSDEDRWLEWYRETGEAEAYSRRLGKRIREGYEAKFRREADQGGNAPLGFRRVPPAMTLAVDEATIGEVVAIFRRYAVGTVSLRELSTETGHRIGHLAEMLRNPIYNGWVSRHGEHQPAAWRMAPPVPDDLWARVEHLRDRRQRGGGRRAPGRVDPLRGLLHCTCGAEVWANGTDRHGETRRAHPFDRACPTWGDQKTFPSRTWATPIANQIAGLRLDDATIAAVVAAVSTPEPAPLPIDAMRLERRRRELALEHAAGRIPDVEYVSRAAALRDQAAFREDRPRPAVDAAAAVGFLQDLATTWRLKMLPAERAELVGSIYERIEVRGAEFVGVTLTPAAYAHGLALALPERVRSDLVSLEGAGPTRSAPRMIRIPIVGRDAWLCAARIRTA